MRNFYVLYAILLVCTVLLYRSSANAVREVADGKRTLKITVDLICDMLDGSRTSKRELKLLRRMVARSGVAGPVGLMLISNDGKVLHGADWSSEHDINVKALDVYSGANGHRERPYATLIEKAQSGGGYVTYRARDVSNVRRAVTVYGRRVPNGGHVLCARMRYTA